MAVELPHAWSVESLAVDVSQNIGTKVVPIVKARFHAVLRLTEDTFVVGHKEGDVVFLKHVFSKGKECDLFGVATSTLKAQTWQTQFRFENDPFRDARQALANYRGRTIIVGSREENDYRNEIHDEEQAAEAARRAAAEEERQRIIRILSDKRSFPCEQKSILWTGRKYLCRIQFTSFEPQAGEVTAVNRWVDSKTGSLKPSNSVKGRLSGNQLMLTEEVVGDERGKDYSISCPGDMAWKNSRQQSAWREFDFVHNQVQRAIEPHIHLTAMLKGWGDISNLLSECTRKCKLQMLRYF